jgi:hypothetical protein
MENICSLSSAASSGAVFILAFPATPSGRWPRAGSKTLGGGCDGSFQAALTWGRARLFHFSIRQHFVDACDDLPRVLDRSLALPDLVQEALTFFLRFFDQRRRRIERYDLLLVHCPAPDQARLALLGREAAPRGQTR